MKRLIVQRVRSIFFQTGIILIITFVLGEISLRIYNHFNPSFVFYSESYNRFRGKPYATDYDFNLNSHGFKDNEFRDKKENEYRILGIGDSLAFGVVPYKYNYLTLIESGLVQKKYNIKVLNMGIPYTGPEDYLSILVAEGLAQQPDMVLLSFFVGNDFAERNDRKFQEWSFVLSLFNYLINIQTTYDGIIFHGREEYCDNCSTTSHEAFLGIEKNRSKIFDKNNSNFLKQLTNALFRLRAYP